MYSPELLTHFYHLTHAGRLTVVENVKTATVGSCEQGDLIYLWIQIDADRIAQARFESYGGVVTLAACEYLCRWLEGKTWAEVQAFDGQQLLAALGLSSLYVHTADRLRHLLRSLV